MIIKNKKGEIAARTLITLILTIVGFVILLIFLISNITKGTFDKEACHQSVIARGSVPSALESYVPLNCKTEKICITNKIIGGKCEDFENSEGVTYVRVSEKEHIEKAIAESMIDCWSMMGEGKLSLFQQYWVNKYGFGDIYPSCVICSRIAFDKNALLNSKINLSEINVETYMATHAIGNKDISYLDYISGENNARINVDNELEFPNIENSGIGSTIDKNQTNDSIQDVKLDLMSASEKQFLLNSQLGDFKVQSKELAVLFMQVSAPKQGETLGNIAKDSLGVGAAAGMTFGFTNAAGAIFKGSRFAVKSCAKSGPVVIGCAVIALGAIFIQQSNVAANRNIAAGYCSDVFLGDSARDGCSVVRTVNYDQESIESYCAVIESST